MQHERATPRLASWLLALALPAAACSSSSPLVMTYSQQPAVADDPAVFELFASDPLLHSAALQAIERIRTATGASALVLADPEHAAQCEPFQAGCGLELSFAQVVYCLGDPDPARACTSQGERGKTLRIQMQAALSGTELENRLIHEFFHVITLNRAAHSADGLFMEYSVGDERISQSTLESVCEHFACSQFVVEEAPGLDAAVGR